MSSVKTLFFKYIRPSLVFLDMFLRKAKYYSYLSIFVNKQTTAPCKLSREKQRFAITKIKTLARWILLYSSVICFFFKFSLCTVCANPSTNKSEEIQFQPAPAQTWAMAQFETLPVNHKKSKRVQSLELIFLCKCATMETYFSGFVRIVIISQKEQAALEI